MTEERTEALKNLEDNLAYRFRDINLLNNALIHRSFVNENPSEACQDNERLEFLGDAVLELCISDLLMKKYPDFTEGQLSKLRASIVNEQFLAELAMGLNIGDYLLLGKGEESSGGRRKASLLSDTMEAVIAAIYLDRGFAEIFEFIKNTFTAHIETKGRALIYTDYKTALQEISQNRFKETPKYTLVGEQGPDHDKTFDIKLSLADIITTLGTGKNKKEAEQQAAKRALEELEKLNILYADPIITRTINEND